MSGSHEANVHRTTSEHAPRPPSRPRWVKVVLILAVVVILVLGAMIVLGGGRHGPSRHLQMLAPHVALGLSR